MIKVFNKTINILLAVLFLGNMAFAIEAEYKNSLVKVELSKTNEDSYKIELYTQKKYTEPLKVVKKSDLSYYILLPETNNAPSKKNVNSQDIKSLSTNLYPYAGADINNGYTKIEINTNKPINFTVSAKSLQSPKPAQTKPAAVAQKPLQTPPKTQVTAQSASKQPASIKPKKEVPEKIVQNKPAVKETVQKPVTKKETVKEQTKKQEVKQDKKEAIKPKKEQTKELEKEIKKPIEKEVLKPVEKEVQKPKAEPVAAKEPVAQAQIGPDSTLSSEVQEIEQETVFDDPIQEPIVDEPIENNFINNTKVLIRPYKNKIVNKLSALDLGLKDIIFISIIAFLLLLFLIVLISRKPKKEAKLKPKAALDEPKTTPASTKNTPPAEPVAEKVEQPAKTIAPADAVQNRKVYPKQSTQPPYKEYLANETPVDSANTYPSKELSQAAVESPKAVDAPIPPVRQTSTLDRFKSLDSNSTASKAQVKTAAPQQPQIAPQVQVQQSQPQAPIQPQKPYKPQVHKPSVKTVNESYEQLSYEPQVVSEQKASEKNINTVSKNHPYQPFKPDIIDDRQQESEIIQKILQEDTFVEIEPNEFPAEQPKKFTPQPNYESEVYEEPKVLSKTEIAPNRGFMCVSYKNNINLMGYIYDDVFALYNFRSIALKDYTIKFRMSEKTDKGANFIVKVDSVKMLVAVTRSSMTLEVAM